jgi:hypothetical protein
MLPAVGFIVPDTAAGFLYRTDSAIAWIEWIVANPAAPKLQRSEALNLIISSLTEAARTMGFKAIFTSAHHPGLIGRFKEHGFTETDSAVTHLIRSL